MMKSKRDPFGQYENTEPVITFEIVTRYNDNKGFNLSDPEKILVIRQGNNTVVLEKANKGSIQRWLDESGN
jgi:hypothetical protein